MRIERENGENVGSVWAVFTRHELESLFLALEYYFNDESPDPQWHHHVGEDESELTVTVADDA